MVLLGDRKGEKKGFPQVEKIFSSWEKSKFSQKPLKDRKGEVYQTLLRLIQETKAPCFLLAEVLDFLERVDKGQLLDSPSFSGFETWLNQFSGLGFEENLEIRSKIVGKRVDRSDYQVFFPVGMGKVYEGSHFVTAHLSPDLDTTIASFWGWVDAFGARVSQGVHIWNVPGGPPSSQIEIEWLFLDRLSPLIFSHLAKTRTTLSLCSQDLFKQEGMVVKTLFDSIGGVSHNRDHTAIVVVDQEGAYLGDWRNLDVEGVRQVIILLSSCLRWFENQLHLQMITLFSEEKVFFADVEPALKKLFSLSLRDCDPSSEWGEKQAEEVSCFIQKVLKIKEGLDVCFETLGTSLSQLSQVPFEGKEKLISLFLPLFDSKGVLVAERTQIFSLFKEVIKQLHEALFQIRERLEKLDIALLAKKEVFGRTPTSLSMRTGVEEIRQKMGNYLSLTVLFSDNEKMFPLGIVEAKDIRKETLGTVSLRDFCNRDEMGIPSYLDVISVIDHHKSELKTTSAPFAVIADVQSTNTLVAGQTFLMNDPYTLRGQSAQSIDQQILEEGQKSPSQRSNRLLEKLWKKKMALQRQGHWFIDPEREYLESLHFLYGILDDTDLLSKVSPLDVERVAELLNRMKSIALQKEVEIVSLDDLPKDSQFAQKGAQRILQQEDMYSLYVKLYEIRERQIEEILLRGPQEKSSPFFADTKEQNGCCRIGQTKLFAKNVPSFHKKGEAFKQFWRRSSMQIYESRSEINLYLHMISTIVSAEEVYRGEKNSYSHLDELWIWIPPSEMGEEHLKRFLSRFQTAPFLQGLSLEVTFYGEGKERLERIFRESFLPLVFVTKEGEGPMAILRYPAGKLNSRKAMISPYLPTGLQER